MCSSSANAALHSPLALFWIASWQLQYRETWQCGAAAAADRIVASSLLFPSWFNCSPPPVRPQNKIDLVTEPAALSQHEAIQGFIQGTIADGAPVVPVSAQLKYNVDVVCEYIVKRIPVPVRCALLPVSALCCQCTVQLGTNLG